MDGGSLRMFQILKLLRESVTEVACLPRFPNLPHREANMAEACERLRQEGISVPGGDKPVSALEHLRAQPYQTVLVSGAYAAQALLPQVRKLSPRSSLIYDTVDLHHVRLFREAKLSGNQNQLRQAISLKRDELANVATADLTLVVTERERQSLLQECPNSEVFVLSNIHEPALASPQMAETKTILFLGAFNHTPNLDAVRYLIEEIMPRVWRSDPSIGLEIVGSNPPTQIQELASERVRVPGFVADLHPVFARSRLSVAPLRFGAGVKGKVLQSMAHGVPVVGTSIAAEGIDLKHGENFMLADNPQAFADQILRLNGDREIWQRLSENGLQFIQREYSSAATRVRLRALLQRLEEIGGSNH